MHNADQKGTAGAAAFNDRARRYGQALIGVAAAALLRYALSRLLGTNAPFVLFYPIIWLVAWTDGLGPGIFAVFLSLVSVSYLSFGPASPSTFGLPLTANGRVLFVIMGVAISALTNTYRRRRERLREFEKAIEGVEEMIAVVDREYRYVTANRAFLDHRGMTKEEVIGRRVEEILHPGVFEETIKPRLGECFQGKIVRFEMQYAYPGLGDRALSVTYLPIEGPGGVERVACVLQDVTERKSSEQSLRLFRSLIDQCNDAVQVVDPKTLRFLDFNEETCRQLGYSREELLQMTVFDVVPALDEAARTRELERLQEAGSVVRQDVRQRKDGSRFSVETSLKSVALERDYIVAVTRDISERKRAEEALRESEDRCRDLVEHSEDLVCTHDLEGKLLSMNPAPARLLGYSVDEMLKISMREMIPAEYRNLFDEYLNRLRVNGSDRGLMVVLTRTGERRTWEYNNTLRTEGVPFPIVRGMAHDVTERRRAELAQQLSEARYRMLFEKNVAGVAISTLEGEIIDCNVAWAQMLGYHAVDEMRGRWTKEFYFDIGDREPFMKELIRAGVSFREMQLRQKDGTPVWLLLNCVVLSGEAGPPVVQTTAIDISKSKHAQEALHRKEEDYRRFVAQSSEGIFRDEMDAPIPIDLPEDELVNRILNECYTAECNDALARMYGLASAKDMVGKRLTDMLVKSDPRNEAFTREYIRSGFRMVERESHEVDQQGNAKVFINNLIGVVDNGKLVRTWGIQRDVTEQVKAEEGRDRAERSLAASEERFRVALKDSPITVFNQDCDLRYTWIYNPQIYWQQDVMGKTDDEIIGPKKAASLVELKRRVLKTGIAAREDVVVSYEGKNYAFDITIEPLLSADGSVIGITGTSMDIARFRVITDRLQDARDKLAQEKSYLENEIQTELGFKEIIGQSPALRAVLKNVRVVAPTDSTVLLLGETGTGKELIARSVHALSARCDKTFVKLNCAAVPSGLLESELFGHERGAFTGAVSQKVGRIELADKGTLFLDEIGELPLELQPKLLRVLQDREFERLGGVHTLRVDVRIISATNRDLQQDVADRSFREDLFYRLNVFPINLPALRDRRSDIPVLVHHFVRKHASRMGKHIANVPAETMAVLQKWNWPGNIRELENMIERMVILSKGRVLAAPPVELDMPQESEDNLTEMEREHILRILRETNGVLSGTDGAASRLGIKRTTLQSMIKRFGIEMQEYRRGSGRFGPS